MAYFNFISLIVIMKCKVVLVHFMKIYGSGGIAPCILDTEWTASCSGACTPLEQILI